MEGINEQLAAKLDIQADSKDASKSGLVMNGANKGSTARWSVSSANAALLTLKLISMILFKQ